MTSVVMLDRCKRYTRSTARSGQARSAQTLPAGKGPGLLGSQQKPFAGCVISQRVGSSWQIMSSGAWPRLQFGDLTKAAVGKTAVVFQARRGPGGAGDEDEEASEEEVAKSLKQPTVILSALVSTRPLGPLTCVFRCSRVQACAPVRQLDSPHEVIAMRWQAWTQECATRFCEFVPKGERAWLFSMPV